MYNKKAPSKTTIKVNKSYEGETIEKKVNRIVNNKEPIVEPGVLMIYTERKDGVKPEYDPRTDRWELGLDAMDKVTKDKLTKRADRAKSKEDIGKQAKEGMEKEKGSDGKPESTAGAGNPS